MHFSPTSLQFMLQSCVLVQGPYSLHREKEFSLEATSECASEPDFNYSQRSMLSTRLLQNLLEGFSEKKKKNHLEGFSTL